MRFEIKDGLPYLIADGRAIPVMIRDGDVKYDVSQAVATELTGRYSLTEVMAKCGNCSSITRRTKRKAGD